MIKKISAIVLALMLCLSVVVMPASALSDGSLISYEIKLDKEYYSAGDDVVVTVFMHADEDTQFTTGAVTIGCHSDLFNMSDNANATVKASASITGTLASTFYKVNAGAWQSNATILSRITGNSTEEENALYDQYFKITLGRQGTQDGSHANSADTKLGFPGSDFNADSDDGTGVLQFTLKLRDDIVNGVKVNIGVPSGTYNYDSNKSYNNTIMNYLTNPGNATTADWVKAAETETVSTTATIGAATVELAMATWKQQIKFGVDKDGAYNDTFSARTFVEFTNFSEVFDDATDALNTDDGDGLLEVGFVYKVGDFDEATAKGYVEAGVVAKDGPKEMTDDGYTVDRRAYVSTTAKAGGYVMGSTIADIPAADKTTNVTVLAYAKYTTGGEPVYVYHPVSGTFETLYNTYYSQAFLG